MGLEFRDIEWAFEVASSSEMSDVEVVVHVPESKLYIRDGMEIYDAPDEFPEDAYENDDYVWIPDKRDLNLGNELVFRFVRKEIPEAYGEVEWIFSRRGAYGRYKGFMELKGLLDKWYKFEEKETRDALLAWCAENGIVLDDIKENAAFNEFFVSTDWDRLDLPLIHKCLSEDSYWAAGRSLDQVETSFMNSLSFGVYNSENKTVGFCRVLTDYVAFAYLMDVYVLKPFRGKGAGRLMLEKVFAHEKLQTIKRWMLATRDAHGLYEEFGFEKLDQPEIFMQRIKEDLA